jgi:chromosome segregation ATPase
MKEKIKMLIDELCAGHEAQLKKVAADAQATINARETGVKQREKHMDGILKKHGEELAAANAKAKDADEKLAKEKAAHKETKEKLDESRKKCDEARKEIETLRPLVKREPAKKVLAEAAK